MKGRVTERCRDGDMKKQRQRSLIYRVTSQLSTTTTAGPDHSQEPAIPSNLPCGWWVQVPGPSSDSFLECVLAGSWIRSRGVGTWTRHFNTECGLPKQQLDLHGCNTCSSKLEPQPPPVFYYLFSYSGYFYSPRPTFVPSISAGISNLSGYKFWQQWIYPRLYKTSVVTRSGIAEPETDGFKFQFFLLPYHGKVPHPTFVKWKSFPTYSLGHFKG